MKRRWILLAEALLGIGLVALLILSLDQRDALWDALQRAAHHPAWLIGGVALFGLALLCGMVRWWVLLRALKLPVQFRWTAATFAMGHFFNVLIPGSTGGDVMKGVYIAHACPGRRTEAITTILLERLIGLLSLILLIAIITAVRLPFFLSSPRLRQVALFNGSLLTAAVAFLVVAVGRDWLTRWHWSRKLVTGSRIGRIIAQAHDALSICLRHPRVLGLTLLLSLGNHLIQAICPWMLGQALGIVLPFWDYLTVYPVINMLASIPLTPGGLGLREAATMELMATVGVGPGIALTLSLMLYGAIVIWSLIGGVLYLLLRHQMPSRDA